MKANIHKDRIPELDGIRGLACLFVLTHHYFTGVATLPLDNEIVRIAWGFFSVLFLSGVDLFYVLSGVLVGGIIIDFYRSSNFLKVFFIKRACRILPVYYLLMLTYVIGSSVSICSECFGPWAQTWLLERPLPLWSYLTFMQSYLMGLAGASGPKWVAITWSVSVEEQFYLLTPFIFLLFGARRAAFIVMFCIVLATLIRAYLFNNLGFYAGYMFFPGRMDTIFWGVGLAFLMRNEKWREFALQKTYYLLVLAACAFAIIVASNLTLIDMPIFIKFTALAIFYFVVIWAALEQRIPIFNKLLRLRFLIFTGMISYAAYMVHQLINGLMHGFYFGSKPVVNSWATFAITLVSLLIVYLVAYLSYQYFEKPILKIGKGFKYQFNQAGQPAKGQPMLRKLDIN